MPYMTYTAIFKDITDSIWYILCVRFSCPHHANFSRCALPNPPNTHNTLEWNYTCWQFDEVFPFSINCEHINTNAHKQASRAIGFLVSFYRLYSHRNQSNIVANEKCYLLRRSVLRQPDMHIQTTFDTTSTCNSASMTARKQWRNLNRFTWRLPLCRYKNGREESGSLVICFFVGCCRDRASIVYNCTQARQNNRRQRISSRGICMTIDDCQSLKICEVCRHSVPLFHSQYKMECQQFVIVPMQHTKHKTMSNPSLIQRTHSITTATELLAAIQNILFRNSLLRYWTRFATNYCISLS